MRSFLGGWFNLGASKYERLKFMLLTLSFALIIGSWTIAKELKDSIFISIVGKQYWPDVKLLVIFLIIPAILLYSRLVDVVRRYQLLAFYCIFYGIVLAVFAVLLGHKTIGLYNTQAGPDRLFGWIFFCVLEGYSPFVVGVFWAFLNSVSSPEEAKNCYPLMVAGSKVGGMATALFAWYLLGKTSLLGCFGCTNHDVVSHQILLGIVSFMLLCIPVVLLILMKTVPGHYLHGYEAVYQLEKQQQHDEKNMKTSMFSGIKLLIESPYILGIFGLVFFYETLNVVLNFQRIGILQDAAKTMAGFTASMFWQRFIMHFSGLILSFFGVQFLLRKLEVRRCLILVPCMVAVLLIFFLFTYNADSVLYLFLGMGTINYSLSYPLREALYIPTTKDIKFKSKAWIDTFGTKFSKGFGSLFAKITTCIVGPLCAMIHIGFFGIIMVLWFVTSWLLGKKYEKTIQGNAIIGNEVKN